MLNDAGYLALILILVFWAILFGAGLVVGIRKRKPTRSHG